MIDDRGLERARVIRVLVVEDERVVARDIKACLENLGYTVPAIAASGEDAIAQAKAIHPDVVLMDIRLDGEMDGTQAAQQIWSDLQIPVVYSSGYSDQLTVDRATATEPFGYVLKPIKEKDLYVAIKTALQRHQLETRLKEREQWLTLILRAIGDGVIVVDQHSRIKFLNLVAEALTGYPPEAAFDEPLIQVLHLVQEHTQTPISDPTITVLQTGKITNLIDSVLLVSRTGTRIPIAVSAAPFLNDNGTLAGAVLVFRDTTERRQAEQQALTLQRAELLERQMEELKRLSQLKDDFLNTISHELRTPLASIKMAIQMLEVALDQRNDPRLESDENMTQVDRYMQILRDQCNQELMLVNDLLDLQRLDANACPLKLIPINLKDWIPHLVEAFEERTQQQQQRLHINLPPELLTVVTDLAFLTRILTELLMNACKYTPPENDITLTVRVHNQSQFRLVVCNTGTEIPIAELPRVFDKFYRVSASDRWKQGGTGLGLALIKKMVTHLNGSIWVESGSGQTCFTVELPLISPLESVD